MRLPFWATFSTFCSICILCTLGTWQLERLKWKTELLQKLETAYNTPHPGELDFKALGDQDFIYGRIKGKLLADEAFLLGLKMKDEKLGADLIIPLQTKNSTVLVNLGWAQGDLKSQPIYHLNGKTVWFDGLARKPTWNNFTPENKPEQNLWYRADIDQIAATKNLKIPVAPVILYAESASHKFDAAFPNNNRIYPENNHAQYAAFWFSMAGLLLIIYGLRFIQKSKTN